jgi:Na+-driven multidrug efflux pump
MAYLWELEGVWFSFLAIEVLTAGIGLRFLLKKNRMKETKQGEEKNVF